MLTMDQIHHIREMYYGQGYKISEIARKEKLDRRTVAKYIDREDFNRPAPKPASEKDDDSPGGPPYPSLPAPSVPGSKPSS